MNRFEEKFIETLISKSFDIVHALPSQTLEAIGAVPVVGRAQYPQIILGIRSAFGEFNDVIYLKVLTRTTALAV